MFEVSVSGWFAAAHQLRLPDGALEPLHGHNWRIEVTFAGEVTDAFGMLVDFVALRKRLDAELAALHDRNLNELAPFARRNPSAENVGLHLAERLRGAGGALARLRCVQVEEAPGCVARYFPSDAAP